MASDRNRARTVTLKPIELPFSSVYQYVTARKVLNSAEGAHINDMSIFETDEHLLAQRPAHYPTLPMSPVIETNSRLDVSFAPRQKKPAGKHGDKRNEVTGGTSLLPFQPIRV